MSRRKRATLSPSLFPFLAVLVCTLGTLILLLALVAQNATDSAHAQAKNKATLAANEETEAIAKQNAAARAAAEQAVLKPRIPAVAVDKMIAEEEFRAAQFVAFRDKQTADLEDRRDQLGHLENHIARLRDELKLVSDEVDRVVDGKPSPPVDQTMLASYRKEIDEEKKTLDQLKEAGPKTPRVVIVPHKGPNGTDRRPIYLECTESGLTIWPEGTRISQQQLADSDGGANPLDAALRVVRRHAMQTYGDTTPPYPLLVVRPDGIETYVIARNAMDKWDDQFGYELVPGEVKLAYNAPDANLKRELETTIARAVANQSPSMMIGRGTGGGGGGGGVAGSAYGRGGSTANPNGEAGGARPRVLSAAQLDLAGRSNGFHTERGNEDFAASARNRSDSNRSDSNRSGSNRNGTSRSGSASSPVTSGYTGDGAYGSVGSGANGGDAASPGAIDPQTQKQWADDMAAAAGELNSVGGFGPGQVSAGDASLNELLGDASSASKSIAGKSTGGTSKLGSADGIDGTTGGDAGDSDADGNAMGLTGPGGKPSSASDANSSQATAGTTGTGGTQSSGSPQNQPSGQQAGDPSSSEEANGRPPADMQMQSPPPRDLVQRKGQNWAIPRQASGIGGNSIVRNMRAQCYGDRLVLLGSVRGGATEMFGINDGDVERATMELATSVRDRISEWGVSMPGSSWSPRLEVEVMPGGEQRFYQLRSVMEGSGVEVIGRQSE